MELFELLLVFMFAHCLADYPLQGDFLAKAKNPNTPVPGVPWYQALFAHSMIHAGFVYLISNNVYIALFELFAHFGIDYLKCKGKIDFNKYQALHFFCKYYYCVLIVYPL